MKFCLNPDSDVVKKLVYTDKFAISLITHLANKYFENGDFTYKQFIEHKEIRKQLGIISKAEVKRAIGFTIPEEMSYEQITHLWHKIGVVNNKNVKNGVKKLYRTVNLHGVSGTSWMIDVVEKDDNIDVDAKLRRHEDDALVTNDKSKLSKFKREMGAFLTPTEPTLDFPEEVSKPKMMTIQEYDAIAQPEIMTAAEFEKYRIDNELPFEDEIFDEEDNIFEDDLPLQKTPSIKSGVPELFESNPELASIGTQEQYSQYLDSLNKPNTNPILQNNQQEQIKKFAELQERLNNKEFLEGAKNIYESSKGLQELGTQEEYNNYIARVSLGILKNPSSGDYNYTSQVKDIVYRGTPENYPIKKGISPSLGEGITFTSDKNWAKSYTEGGTNPTLHIALINIKTPIILKDNIDNLSEDEIDNYIQQKATKSNDGTISLNEYLIVEPEQIHILSSKKDLEMFAEFVRNKSISPQEFSVESNLKDLDFNEETLKYLYERSSKSKDFSTFAKDVLSYVALTRSSFSVEEIIEKLNCL